MGLNNLNKLFIPASMCLYNQVEPTITHKLLSRNEPFYLKLSNTSSAIFTA